jgi:hypothetical protein
MVVGVSPAVALGIEYVALANAQSLAAYNVVFV